MIYIQLLGLSTKNNPMYMQELIPKKGLLTAVFAQVNFSGPLITFYATFCMRSGFSIVDSVIRNMKGAIQARECGNVTSASARGGFF